MPKCLIQALSKAWMKSFVVSEAMRRAATRRVVQSEITKIGTGRVVSSLFSFSHMVSA